MTLAFRYRRCKEKARRKLRPAVVVLISIGLGLINSCAGNSGMSPPRSSPVVSENYLRYGIRPATLNPRTNEIDSGRNLILRGRIKRSENIRIELELEDFLLDSRSDLSWRVNIFSRYALKIRFPFPGRYTVNIYSDKAPGKELLISYRVNVRTEKAFPVSILNEEAFQASGFSRDRLSLKQASTESGNRLVIYLYGHSDTELHADITPLSRKEQTQPQKVFQEVNDGEYKLTTFFGEQGRYILRIWSGSGTESFQIRYLIEADSGIAYHLIPQKYGWPLEIVNRELYRQYGIRHTDFGEKGAYSSVRDMLTVSLDSNPDVEIRATLKHISVPDMDFQNRVAVSRNNSRWNIVASFPGPGRYRLTVEAGRQGSLLFGPLFAYLIDASESMNLTSFQSENPNILNPDQDEMQLISRRQDLRSNTIELVAVYPPRGADFARRYIDLASRYLPPLETYLNTSFPHTQSAILMKEEVSFARFRRGNVLFFQRHINKLYPPILFHEYGHQFFSSRRIPSWFVEGVNSFLPIAMHDAGYLPLSPSEIEENYRHWGLRNVSTASDSPLQPDFRRSGGNFSFFYIKSYKLVYQIYKELGPERFRSLVVNLSNHEGGTLENNLKNLKDINWNRFFSGWVYGREYLQWNHEDFRDSDGNGIIQIDEWYRDNPGGLPEGWGLN